MHEAIANRHKALCRLALVAGLASLLVPMSSGCGDGPICASEIVVVIGSLSDGDDITTDSSTEPGMQIDVPVRSNLAMGDQITLTVIDGSGQELSTLSGMSDSDGNVFFEDVDVPVGPVTLRVVGASEECGSGMDEVQVNVVGQAACDLFVREGPLTNDYYAPLPVLNATIDTDAALPNFQANIDVITGPGFDVELFVLDVDSAVETSAGVVTAEAGGLVEFPLTLAQGRQALRAECVSASGAISASSGTTAVFVDTEVPTCGLVNPAEGASIIPALDMDGNPDNGTQVTLLGNAAADGDVEGENATFTINGAALDSTAIDANGDSTAMASFDTVGSYELTFTAQDHAGNVCSVTRSHDYVTEGCGITYVGPQDAVISDANGEPTDGFQAQVQVQVDSQCVGQTVTTDCGMGATSVEVPDGGLTTLEVTMCSEATCEQTDSCSISVTSAAGITTSVGATIIADNQPPGVSLQFVEPDLSCGGALVPDADVDGDPANGVQIDVRVVSPLAATRSVEVTGAAGTSVTPADVGGDARITLEPGVNDVIAVAADQYDNEARTPSCSVSVLDVVVGFDPPIDDGLVGSADGTVAGDALTLDICGTVSETDASVEVAIDGGLPQAATVVGTSWCLAGVTLAESPPAHTIDVSVVAGTQLGTGSLSLVVDLTPTSAVGTLAAVTPTRQSAELSWIAPEDGGLTVSGYIVKMATEPLDDSNFDTVGTVIDGPAPGAPGTSETLLIEQLEVGTEYYFGVAALDDAGNRSVAEIVGPVVPSFDATGAIGAVDPADGENGLGYQVARGDFNGDGYFDVAVAAPYKGSGLGAVYVYFGGTDGLGSAVTPDVIIEGTAAGAQFGNGLTAVQWGGDAADDLAVGAPYVDGGNGQAYIFYGGASLSSATSPADADVVIGVGGGWFTSGFLGWSIASAHFDNDADADLIMSVPGGGAGNGGIVVVYGGSGETSILLDDLSAAGSGDAVALAIEDPDPATFDVFGQWVIDLGRTEGSADANDDIGVAYAEGSSVYVIRGRQQPATPGTTLASVNLARDLEIQNDTEDTDGFVAFGSTMGSIEDQNGDNARDVVIGSWGEATYDGRVVIVDGDAVGAQRVTTIELTDIRPAPGVRAFGTAVANNALAITSPDLNNDGQEDLLIVGGSSGGGTVDVSMFVWYGGAIPTGDVTTDTAAQLIAAPTAFDANIPPSGGTPIVASWAGDVNNDGLEDICWADYLAQTRDGVFEVLWDDGM